MKMILTKHQKKMISNSTYHLCTILTLAGILLLIIFSWLSSADGIILPGVILIVCLYETLYIHGMFSAGSNFFIKTIKGKEFFNHQPGILFRFDDGPHPLYTPQILDILKTEGIQALFAVTGENAELYPEIVARIYRENHIIANHTYSHPCNILFLSYKRIRMEIIRTNTIIKNITGEEPIYFCPPIGHKNQVIGKVIQDLKLIPVMWDIRTLDTWASFERIMAVIKRKLKPPAIIMFHDAIAPFSKNSRESTILALQETVRLLKEQKISLNKKAQR